MFRYIVQITGLFLSYFLIQQDAIAQVVPIDTLKELGEIIISANKFPEKKKNIAQKIDIISSEYISAVNTQNTGDLLMRTGNIFVQKSKQGGSSPVIRGF